MIRTMTKTGKKYLVVKHKQKYAHIIVYFTRKFKKIWGMGKKEDRNNIKGC